MDEETLHVINTQSERIKRLERAIDEIRLEFQQMAAYIDSRLREPE